MKPTVISANVTSSDVSLNKCPNCGKSRELFNGEMCADCYVAESNRLYAILRQDREYEAKFKIFR